MGDVMTTDIAANAETAEVPGAACIGAGSGAQEASCSGSQEVSCTGTHEASAQPCGAGSGAQEASAQLDAKEALRRRVMFRCGEIETLSLTLLWFWPIMDSAATSIRKFFIKAWTEFGYEKLYDFDPETYRCSLEIVLPVHDAPYDLHLELSARNGLGKTELIDSFSIYLPRTVILLNDNGSSNFNWEHEGTWERDEEGNWNDSPGGNYSSNADYSLTSPIIALGGVERTVLVFEEKHSIEKDSDFCYLEIQCGDGPWERLAAYTGYQDWEKHYFCLERFDGNRIRIRFRMWSDRTVTREGFAFRNLVMSSCGIFGQ